MLPEELHMDDIQRIKVPEAFIHRGFNRPVPPGTNRFLVQFSADLRLIGHLSSSDDE